MNEKSGLMGDSFQRSATPAGTPCPNCGHGIAGSDRFCPSCGQEHRDLRVPFKHLMEQAVEGVFHLDARVFRTMRSLLFRPGSLTVAYLEGRRKQFVAPVRLYLVISLLFFFVISLSGSRRHGEHPGEAAGNGISMTYETLQSSELRYKSATQVDSLMRAKGMRNTLVDRYIVHQLARIENDGMEDFLHLFFKSWSYLMFLLMPLFAALMHWIFRKGGRYYGESVIAAIHFHAFIFFAATFSVLVGKLTPIEIVLPILAILSWWYLYRTVLAVYGCKKIRSVLNLLILVPVYLFLSAMVLFIGIFISILLV
jgi:hypothetical protein